MWFESQNCAMMGLQATTGKRKLEAATAPGESSPAKSGRWEVEDCIARLQAVAVPSDPWRSPTPALAATLLSNDDFDDEDEFDDELSDDGTSVPDPAHYNAQQPTPAPYHRYHHHHPTNDYYHQYYQPPQQTIRCEENGKSYLELGASPPIRTRCCDGRTHWCHVPCYRQRRLAVLNLSMCKLARFRQCTDPSLRRSVLICNTLRKIEREMESEPPEPSSCYQTLPEMTPPSRLCPVPEVNLYEQSLREMTSQSGRATPFPQNTTDTDSGIGDDETTRPINWSSVLNLTSQTDLESLNNNDLYAELGLGGDTQEWSASSGSHLMTTTTTSTTMVTTPSRQEYEWDGFIQVLVGGS
ncbi:uncharacterized protein [Onthophagus taurus]|uniref:uncharacterized protein n=1 Tax=Onthophagus taurus TaxID=166361 RepID=UPI000C20B1AA|nr:uncharacterized protein LOC111423826 [Onthophagus taurus]